MEIRKSTRIQNLFTEILFFSHLSMFLKIKKYLAILLLMI